MSSDARAPGQLLLGRPRRLDRQGILAFLRQASADRHVMQELRRLLAEELGRSAIHQMRDQVVLDKLADGYLRGTLSLVLVRPREVVFEGYSGSEEVAPAPLPNEEKKGDTRPAPEVPPEYIILARVESDEVIESTAELNAELSDLLFDMFARQKLPSTVAPTFLTVSEEEADRVGASRSAMDTTLDGEIYAGGGVGRPDSSVPEVIVTVADEAASMTKSATDELVGAVSGMFVAGEFVRRRGEAGEAG